MQWNKHLHTSSQDGIKGGREGVEGLGSGYETASHAHKYFAMICLSCIQAASAADTVWVWKDNNGSPEIVTDMHACYIYAALTLLLHSKAVALLWFKMKFGEEFVLRNRSSASTEWILFKLETQLVSIHSDPICVNS